MQDKPSQVKCEILRLPTHPNLTTAKARTGLTQAEKIASQLVFEASGVGADGTILLEDLKEQFKYIVEKIYLEANTKDKENVKRPEEKVFVMDDEESVGEDQIDGIIADLDITGNGRLTWEEFLKVIKDRLLLQKEIEDPREMFRVFDVHGTGFLSASEFRRLMTTSGKNSLTDDDVDKLLHVLDRNGDGVVDYYKFVAWLQKNRALND